MRVAIDATPLILSTGGLRRYVEQLSCALAGQFPDDRFCLVSDQPFEASLECIPNVEVGQQPRNAFERRWWLLGLNEELKRQKSDVFHGTNFEVPYITAKPSVVTIHDLSPWMDKGWHAGANRVRERTPWLIRTGRATMVIAVSDVIRRQVIEFFRVSKERVVAVPNGVNPSFRPVDPEPGPDHFLYLGTIEPRKNLPMLVEAWRPVFHETGVELWLAGRQRSDAASFRDEPGLRILGEVSEASLPALYSSARAVLYPSLYEGFGLPVLEAMRCGAAVIASTDPAIAEVGGDAILRVDARSAKAWTDALLSAARGDEWLADLRPKALRRSMEFSWERTACLTHQVYEEAVQRFHG